jgi:protein SCO1
MAAPVLPILALLMWSGLALTHEPRDGKALPVIGPAPAFTLTSQDGAEVALAALRGKVVAVTFGYTSCPDICPLLTTKLLQVQDELGPDFGAKIDFVFITVDPEHDTPELLKDYAQAYGAKLDGWSFLTGSPAEIRDVTRRYGVFASKNEDGSVDHTLVTSLIDPSGMMRVQYLGYRFNPKDLRRDLLSLVRQP